MSATVAACVLACGLPIAAGATAIDRLSEARRMRSRIGNARSRALGLPIEAPRQRKNMIATSVEALGRAITASRLVSVRTRTELEQTLRAGGLITSYSLELFVGSKIVLAVVLPLGAFMLLRHAGLRPFMLLSLVATAGVTGLMLPNMIIGQRRKTYLSAVDRGLSDGLDMMVICAEAGLSLEATLQRVSIEVEPAHPRLAAELVRTSNELSMVADSRNVLAGMGARTGLTSLKRLGATMIQSLQYGTPLSSALRTLAIELRQETLTRFEERAARLPVLLTIPMIVFILPCVFLVVTGPILVHVLKTMTH